MKRALYYAESYGARSERLDDDTLPSLDIRDLVDRIADALKPIPLEKWTSAVHASLDKAVLSSKNGDFRRRSHGLAIFAPRTAAQNKDFYAALPPLGKGGNWMALFKSINTEAAKHANDPVAFSDVEFVSLVRDGKPVIRPFNGDMLRFKLSGTSVIQVNQIDMRRDGDSWVILRRRWVPDPAWMTRSKRGASELADLFMPNFSDKENNLAVELTCQCFLVTNGKTTVNLTLDGTNPAHGATLTTLAKLTRKGEKEPIRVEISFDPVHWVAVKVQPLSDKLQVA